MIERVKRSLGLRRFAFVFVVATILVVGSERVFWYWAPSVTAHPELALFYAFAAAAMLWLIDRYRVDGWWSLLLAAPVLAYVVEGVITPVLYEGGPFVPLLPAFLVFWHGTLSAVALVFLIRYWLISDDRRRLLWFSVAFGAFWGSWAITSSLPEALRDPEMVLDLGGRLQLLDPGEFTSYAFTFTAVLAGAHWLLGAGLWRDEFRPSPVSVWLYLGVAGAVVVGWTTSIPWAAPMFTGYVALQVWALRRHERRARGPGLLSWLQGPVLIRSLVPLVALPAAAAAVYAAWWRLDPGEEVIRAIYESTVFTFILLGLGVGATAIVRAVRSGSTAQVRGEA